MKPCSSFLVGCMAGLLITSSLCMWWSGSLACDRLYPTDSSALPPLQPQGRHTASPKSIAAELQSGKTLLIVVLTSRRKLKGTVEMISKTWMSQKGADVDCRVFVAGNGPPTPNVYWMGKSVDFHPTGGNREAVFHLLSFLRDKFSRHYRWFAVVSGNTYVATKELEIFLSRLDSSSPVYMGRPSSEKEEERRALRLIPDELYCQWGPGIILNIASLNAIAPYLDSCRRAAANFAGSGTLASFRLERGEVELGRCFNRVLGIKCTNSSQVGIANMLLYHRVGRLYK